MLATAHTVSQDKNTLRSIKHPSETHHRRAEEAEDRVRGPVAKAASIRPSKGRLPLEFLSPLCSPASALLVPFGVPALKAAPLPLPSMQLRWVGILTRLF